MMVWNQILERGYKLVTIAENKLKWMRDCQEKGSFVDESEIRESAECIAIIWPGRNQDSDGYWLDIFEDGSAIENVGAGCFALTAKEAKAIAGRWKTWREDVAPYLKK